MHSKGISAGFILKSALFLKSDLLSYINCNNFKIAASCLEKSGSNPLNQNRLLHAYRLRKGDYQ